MQDWFRLERRFGYGFGWFWGTERLFVIIWLLGVELGEVLGSFSRAGEVVVVGAVKVFVVLANRNKRKNENRRLTTIEVSVELSHDGKDEKGVWSGGGKRQGETTRVTA